MGQDVTSGWMVRRRQEAETGLSAKERGARVVPWWQLGEEVRLRGPSGPAGFAAASTEHARRGCPPTRAQHSRKQRRFLPEGALGCLCPGFLARAWLGSSTPWAASLPSRLHLSNHLRAPGPQSQPNVGQENRSGPTPMGWVTSRAIYASSDLHKGTASCTLGLCGALGLF